MDIQQLYKLLHDLQEKHIDIDSAVETLKALPYHDMGFAKIDTHRHLRLGVPEVIFCQGKRLDQIVRIAERLVQDNKNIMATRADPEVFDAIQQRIGHAEYSDLARIVVIKPQPFPKKVGRIAVVCAGTADVPVAEEARVVAETLGNHVETFYDVGVAGIHRLLDQCHNIMRANVIITVAGMEGALASVVGGLSDKPVIAVPTSVGYGASFHGLSALLTMLNSCAPGISVVNIDNGFGAAYQAHLINQLGHSTQTD
ncbi:1-(5-phosphoribosyl)-5-amino-4-imidazole-carboxylate carboxylase [candidate division KSB3 bacterium]|uniref:1-(5-phosphoribosyl)-5-amino-4-imidazole-carboxylate carboxylase n=1 Tax=candidate division KSB3 bacterium TaxID=2044937 RepID=A0A2G6E150_9BACT|nr:MAG: 1-(5-phosphoribosyl)-5-amino-4-imidazole-carboxylate carboxylase [candidate division KSB3 bacterium]PIE30351.1 MAG: 1-(5-phosphoribosyl)-5-amino-4-imidazole-carboxylate carboxylase [candidate division KSB3 bacterium]